jgi:DNA-binding XRE family transcriptional regulator
MLNDNAPLDNARLRGPTALRAELEAMRNEPTIPHAVVVAILDGAHPVRAWREYRGMTQAQLAEAAPINPAYLSQAENGKPISDKMLRRLAKALGAPVDSLRDD